MQQNGAEGVPANHLPAAYSSLGNRDRCEEMPSYAKFLPSHYASRPAAKSRGRKVVPGLFDPNLIADQLEADERLMIMDQRRRLREATLQTLAASPKRSSQHSFARQRHHRRSYDNNADANQCAVAQHTWKREPSFAASQLSSLIVREKVASANHAELSSGKEEGVFPCQRPVEALTHGASLNHPLLLEQEVSLRHLQPQTIASGHSHRQRTRQWNHQSGGVHQRRLHNKQPLAATYQEALPASPLARCKPQQSHALQAQNRRVVRTFKQRDLPATQPTDLFKASAATRAGLSLQTFAPTHLDLKVAQEASRKCQDSNGGTLAHATVISKTEVQHQQNNWLIHLRCTRLHIRKLQKQLTAFVSLSRLKQGNEWQDDRELSWKQSWLEALLLNLADTLRNGPPRGTAQGKAALLVFLQQRRDSSLCVQHLRQLLKQVQESLKLAAQTPVLHSCRRPQLSSKQTTVASQASEEACVSEGGAQTHELVSAIGQQVQVTKQQAHVRYLSGASSNALKLMGTEIQEPSYDGEQLMRVQDFADVQRSASAQTNKKISTLEAERCLLRVHEADARAATTLQYLGLHTSSEAHNGRNKSITDHVQPSYPAPLGEELAFAAHKVKCQRGTDRTYTWLHMLTKPHQLSPVVRENVMAFRAIRMELQITSEPILCQGDLQHELRLLEDKAKARRGGMAGPWTLQAAVAEQLLQRELQHWVDILNSAVTIFVNELIAAEASRMAKVVQSLWDRDAALDSEEFQDRLAGH
ncbi:hypothetical protein Efla_006803 [Eimeria flavescens]